VAEVHREDQGVVPVDIGTTAWQVCATIINKLWT
jgi:hypothetical protein